MFERTAYPFIPPSIFILSSCRPKMSSDDESSSSSSPSLAVVKVVNDHAINTATTPDCIPKDNVEFPTTSNSSTIHTDNTSSSSRVSFDILDTPKYTTIRIDDALWSHRLQDNGCSLAMLPKATYNRSKIPPVGPKESPTYYYNISSIAIDYLKTMRTEQELSRGWKKVPVNQTDAKNKIIGLLLSLRKEQAGVYVLEQERIIGMLANVWGGDENSDDTSLHHNDRIRLFGIIMSIDTNRPIFERLTEGCTSRQKLDDPQFNLKQIFQTLAFSFNNEKIFVEISHDAYDVPGVMNINANDFSRIKITRDCK